MKPFTHTNTTHLSLAILFLRLMTGFIMFGSGAGKVVKWFGGFGMEMTIQFYKASGIPTFWAYMSSYTEFICGMLLMIGFVTRPAALLIFINMIVATILTMPKGFFMGGGSFPFTLMVSALIILITGPLAFSVDGLLSRDKKFIQHSA